MKKIDFDPAKLTGADATWWQAWQARADAATQKAIDAWEKGEEVKFEEKVWGDLKAWLLEHIFHDKCAYCETKAVRFPGHAEHFRPKGRVDALDPASGKFVPVKVEWPNGRVETHPGYFWLAYNWRNLLPACQDCNSGRGKQNKFPIGGGQYDLCPTLTAAEARTLAARARASVKWRGRYYLDPVALDQKEKPNLLNPYVDDPHKHLRFGKKGIVAAVDNSPMGLASIDTYQLKDDKLRVERQAAQEKAEMIYRSKAAMLLLNGEQDIWDKAFAAVESFTNGVEPYSVAALDYLDVVVQELKK